MAINATEEDIELDIPPQELQPYDIVHESEDFFDSDNSDVEPIPKEKRLDKVIDSLRLDHLNDEEKTSVLEIIKDYPDIFHLPGDHLTATNVFQHSIETTDETPVYVKKYRYPPAHKDEMTKQVDHLLKNAIIEH